VLPTLPATVLDGGALGDADGLGTADGDAEADADGDVGFVGAAAGSALRLPACLPKKYMPMASPTMATNPMIERTRLLDALMEPTSPRT
jgi:hypothetical protein